VVQRSWDFRIMGHVGPERFESIHKQLLLLGETSSVKLVLDVGAEVETWQFLRMIFPGATVVSLNINKTDVRQLVVGDAHKIPLKTGSVDFVFAGEIIEHLYNPQIFVSEVSRVLKPNGMFLVTTPNMVALPNRLLILFGYSPINYTVVPGMRIGLPSLKKLRDFGNQDHVRVFSLKALLQLMGIYGFECIRLTGVNVTHKSAKYRFLRKLLSHVLPVGMREDIIALFRKVS